MLQAPEHARSATSSPVARLRRFQRARCAASTAKRSPFPSAVAFLYTSTREGCVVACYPGPAGATHWMLDLRAWEHVLSANPSLRGLQPDVEAVLVRRTRETCEALRVPIDRCYALVGLLRQHWHGVTGGEAARVALDDFFRSLRHA